MPTWGRDGTTRLLVVDLDVKRGDVAGDAAQLTAQLEACGARVVVNASQHDADVSFGTRSLAVAACDTHLGLNLPATG